MATQRGEAIRGVALSTASWYDVVSPARGTSVSHVRRGSGQADLEGPITYDRLADQGRAVKMRASRCTLRVSCHFAGTIRIAWPPPGASRTRRREAEVTGRRVMVSGRGLSSQLALGPSA